MRITGTEAAYRRGLDEFVWRDPSIYLNEEFLQRCMGLPVVIEHPEKATLDTHEYRDRVIGAIMLPYIKGNEVWGIARINDLEAAKVMEENQVSTSPAVVFRPEEASNRTEMDNGSKLLIEGVPSLLDHLAVCERGVWDKGGEATGVQNDVIRGDSQMDEEAMKADAARRDADEKERADRARMDAEAGEKLDKMLSKIDALCSRMDAMEEEDKKRKGSEEEEERKADKAKKDEDEEKEDVGEEEKKVAIDKSRKDAKRKDESEEEEKKEEESRKDAELADLKAQVSALARLVRPTRLSDEERTAMIDAQARADSVYRLHGKEAPRPMDGETLVAYRRRLADGVRAHSKNWSDVDIGGLADAALSVAERQIYADADEAGRRPPVGSFDGLRAIKRQDEAGRTIIEYVGDPRSVYNPPRVVQYFKGFAGRNDRLA